MSADTYPKRVCLGGCIGAVVLSFITVPLLMLFLHFIGFNLDPDTTERTPLSGSPTPTSFFRDAGDAITDPQELNAAMSEFYQQTGVAPFLYIMPEDAYIYRSIASTYGSLYGPTLPQKERTYFTVVYSAHSQSGYDIDIDVGYKAQAVMDEAAIQVFEQNLYDDYLEPGSTLTETFANAYRESAHDIMEQEVEDPTKSVCIVFGGIGIAVVISIIVCALLIQRHRKKLRERERQEYIEQMLEMPLEKFGDTDVEELARKYE